MSGPGCSHASTYLHVSPGPSAPPLVRAKCFVCLYDGDSLSIDARPRLRHAAANIAEAEKDLGATDEVQQWKAAIEDRLALLNMSIMSTSSITPSAEEATPEAITHARAQAARTEANIAQARVEQLLDALMYAERDARRTTFEAEAASIEEEEAKRAATSHSAAKARNEAENLESGQHKAEIPLGPTHLASDTSPGLRTGSFGNMEHHTLAIRTKEEDIVA
jgi:hypothetical protein